MNKYTLEDIFDEVYTREYGQYDNVPKHCYSLKHKMGMKKIFDLYEKNKCELQKKDTKDISTYKLRFNRKTVKALIIAIILAIFV